MHRAAELLPWWQQPLGFAAEFQRRVVGGIRFATLSVYMRRFASGVSAEVSNHSIDHTQLRLSSVRPETAMFGTQVFTVRSTPFFTILIAAVPRFVWFGRSGLELDSTFERRVIHGFVTAVPVTENCTLLGVYSL